MSAALRRIVTVAAKEIVDTLRDRRTIMITLLTSMAAGPLFLALILNMTANQAEKGRDLKLAVAGAEHAPALMAFLRRAQVTINTGRLRSGNSSRRSRRRAGGRPCVRSRRGSG
jgi:sodium transport system permease protein